MNNVFFLLVDIMDQELRALKLSVRYLLEGKQETLPGPVGKFNGEKQRKHYFISKNVLLSWT